MQVSRKALAVYLTQPVVIALAKTGVTPNMVTLFGLAITLGAAALVGTGHPFAAGWIMLLAGYFDIIDGSLARRTGQVTRFGGILDSTLDRVSEAVMIIGLMAYYIYHNTVPPYGGWIIVLLGVALTGSFLVSYIRSRAEAAGSDCQVGIFTRAERVILLAAALLLSNFSYVLVTVIGIIAALSLFTAVQRLVYVYRQVKG